LGLQKGLYVFKDLKSYLDRGGPLDQVDESEKEEISPRRRKAKHKNPDSFDKRRKSRHGV